MKRTVLSTIVLGLLLISCFNDLDDNRNSIFQPETPSATNPIAVGSDRFNTLQSYLNDQTDNATDCIQFLYPVTINVFDENLEFLNFETIENKQAFIEFLASLNTDLTISISYPIIYTNDNGDEISITNNDELEEKLQQCIDIALEIYCTGLLVQEECFWRVAYSEGGNNDYEDAVFKISSVGITTFEHNDVVIFGGWTVLASYNQLYFNIYLDDESEIATAWNKNWIVSVIDENQLLLQDGESNYFIIEKVCNTQLCPKYIFEECQSELEADVATFDLENYISCFAYNMDLTGTSITFYTSEFDASMAINPLISPYLNVDNPEYIYVRIENEITGEFELIKILIAAVEC
ncbi:MAG: hypothetical protein R2797_04025 [Gelidibacter sp.]